MKSNELKDKSVVILGFAREGRDVFSFLKKSFPNKKIAIADKKELKDLEKESLKLIKNNKDNVKLFLGKGYLENIKKYEVIIKSPGIPFKDVEKYGNKIITETEIFFDNAEGKIIGVTGTKGKSTTSSLIYKILKDNGFSVQLLGNIGIPVLKFLDFKGYSVYELSSHQLYNLKKSPKIAVFLNVYPEHLDYYKSFKDYYSAKANICLFQGKDDFLAYNSKNKIVKEIAEKSKAKKIDFNSFKLPGQKININLENIKAALAVSKIFKIPEVKALKSIYSFKTLPHRLEFIGNHKGIKFYNDSLSTIPQSAEFAIDFLGKDLETIILGGFDRGVDFNNLIKKIKKSSIKTVILFPLSGLRIERELKKDVKTFLASDMKSAVSLCYKHTKKGKICLLSPASPSFGMFKDYKDRGDMFKKLVKEYGV